MAQIETLKQYFFQLTLLITACLVIAPSKAFFDDITHAAAQYSSAFQQQSDSLFEEDWGDDPWSTEVASPFSIFGFIEAAQGQFTQSNIVDDASSLSELRGQIEYHYQHEQITFIAKGDVAYDHVLSKSLWDTRELSVSATPLSYVDVKIGRQVLTWGTGDYLFLNDLFPKDWQSFFAGRDDKYLKSYSDSVKTSWFINKYTVDIVWTPEFKPDDYLTGERFSFYSPYAQQQIAPNKAFNAATPSGSQWSARIATSHQGVEYALYGYKGYWTSPLGINNEFQPSFPKMNSWGASARTPLNNGIFNAEYVYYNSIENHNGRNQYLPNSQHRLLLGYEQELLKNVTIAGQYYLEHTKQYRYLSNIQQDMVDQNRHLLTMRLTYLAKRQTLNYSLFVFYSPSDKDSYIKPSVQYRMNDQWSYSIGANIFTGKNDNSFFGQHQDNSNIWLRIRWNY